VAYNVSTTKTLFYDPKVKIAPLCLDLKALIWQDDQRKMPKAIDQVLASFAEEATR
jgi:hypothetical protein